MGRDEATAKETVQVKAAARPWYRPNCCVRESHAVCEWPCKLRQDFFRGTASEISEKQSKKYSVLRQWLEGFKIDLGHEVIFAVECGVPLSAPFCSGSGVSCTAMHSVKVVVCATYGLLHEYMTVEA